MAPQRVGFADEVLAHMDGLRRFAYGMCGDEHHAADLVQEPMLKEFRNALLTGRRRNRVMTVASDFGDDSDTDGSGAPIGTVRARMHRGRKLLARRLGTYAKHQGYTRTSATNRHMEDRTMKTALLTLLVVLLSPTAHAQIWSPQPSGTTVLLHGVWFVSSQRGWAVGDNGTSISTTDGGASWTAFTLTTQGLQDVAFLDQSTGIVVGDNGLIFRTTNGGLSWSPTPSGTSSQLRAAAFGGGGAAVTAGRDGTILRSTDNGATWTLAGTGTVRYRGAAARGSSAWVVGEGGIINATTTSGASWAPQASGTSSDLHGVFFLNAAEGWACGQNSTVLYTSNGGVTWTPRNAGINQGLDAVWFVSPLEGWVSGTAGAIYRTTNGGVTWAAEASGTAQKLTDLHFPDANRGWAAGASGTILRRTAPTGVAEATERPAQLQLEQNYPNPFNPATTIGFSLREDMRIRVAVYDLLGREVARVADGVFPAGAHQVRFDADGLPGGVYFYRLESTAASASAVRTMVLLK